MRLVLENHFPMKETEHVYEETVCDIILSMIHPTY